MSTTFQAPPPTPKCSSWRTSSLGTWLGISTSLCRAVTKMPKIRGSSGCSSKFWSNIHKMRAVSEPRCPSPPPPSPSFLPGAASWGEVPFLFLTCALEHLDCGPCFTKCASKVRQSQWQMPGVPSTSDTDTKWHSGCYTVFNEGIGKLPPIFHVLALYCEWGCQQHRQQ